MPFEVLDPEAVERTRRARRAELEEYNSRLREEHNRLVREVNALRDERRRLMRENGALGRR